MKIITLRSILALLLAAILCITLVSCGADTKPEDKPSTPQADGGETRPEIKVMSKEEFVALFEDVTITNDNVFDYFEIKSDGENFILSPKENVLSYVSNVQGYGFYSEFGFDCTYKVDIIEADGTFTPSDDVVRSESNTSAFSTGSSVKIWSAVPKLAETAVPPYKMTASEINNFKLTNVSQVPHSVCVLKDLTPYYNDIDGEKVILYKEPMEGAAATDTFCYGITASGKYVDMVRLDEKNGKFYLPQSGISYSTSVNENDYKEYGNNAWFRTLYEYNFMPHN